MNGNGSKTKIKELLKSNQNKEFSIYEISKRLGLNWSTAKTKILELNALDNNIKIIKLDDQNIKKWKIKYEAGGDVK